MCMIRLNADLLRALRQGRGLELDALAAAVSIDKRTLSSWESGDLCDPRVSKLLALADFYEVPLMTLLTRVPVARAFAESA